MSKKALYNGCARSAIIVIPSNWDIKLPERPSEKALKSFTKIKEKLMNQPWLIYYRFYDPKFKDTKEWGKLIPVKGMNEYGILEERQKITAGLLKEVERMLDVEGYNPITGQFMAPQAPEEIKEIDPNMHFINAWYNEAKDEWQYTGALWEGYKKLTAIPDTLADVRSVIRGVAKAAEQLFDNKLQVQYCDIPISQITTRHIKYILEQCGKNIKRWSNSRFNKYKAYMSMIFEQLKEVEAMESNPTKDIKSKKKTRKMRAVLTPEEEEKINELRISRYNFWRYIHIFSGSQARTTELLEVKKDHRVNLLQQEFIVTVRKGKEVHEDIRPIPDDILWLWQELWDQAKPGQYLFSKFLQPGDQKIRKDQIGRRWAKYVKASVEEGGLGINKDFYPLKHLRTDKVAEALDLEHAKAGTGHTNDGTALIYAQGEKRRRLNKVKKIPVKLGGGIKKVG